MNDRPEWADDLVKDIKWLKDQMDQNCTKLSTIESDVSSMKKQLDGHSLTEIFDMCEAHGQNIEVLSNRIGDNKSRMS